MNKKKKGNFAYDIVEFTTKAKIHKVAFIWKYDVIYLFLDGNFGDATIQFRDWEI